MTSLLRKLRPNRTPKAPNQLVRRARPGVEALEDRRVPTVTFHGGPVLPNVDVQGLYYGSDWWNNSYYYNQTGYLDGFLNNVVHSTYMDMLNNAGYGVSRGSFEHGWVNGVGLDKSQYLGDGQIRNAIVGNINAGHLKAPLGNQLYVVFVEDNVVVGNSQSNSSNAFLGYHNSFLSWTVYGVNRIRYAVIPYAGGKNLQWSFLSTLGSMTLTTSHELAEAVTDPDPTSGWNDDAYQNGEVGDLANAQTVFLNGYAVQRIADKNDQPMTPAGATSVNPVNFVLTRDGKLYMKGSYGLTLLTTGVASLSDQGIDNFGHAMVDIVTTGGGAWEYHEGSGWTYLTSGVKMAKAGQGVSYVLYNNGTVYEYKDSGGWSYIGSNATSIDAGTDRYGVNSMDEVWLGSFGYEWSDSTGWHYIDSNVKAVSAGPQGFSCYLTNNGVAFSFIEANGLHGWLGVNVAQVTAGTARDGGAMIDLLLNGGTLREWRYASGWNTVAYNVQSIGKAHAGVIDMVFGGGNAWAFDGYYWYFLDSNAQTAA
jgi:hypothetical protein